MEQVLHVNGHGRLPIKLASSPDPAPEVAVQPPGCAVTPTAAAGATTMVTSVWVLPETAPHAELLEQLRDGLLQQGGIGFVLSIPTSASAPDVDEAIVARFRSDRGREYDEFAERCSALLEEIGREGKAGKYSFAEMEESEQDLEKLVRWLAKIQARDFFPYERGQEAAAMLARCQTTVAALPQAAYAAENVNTSGASRPQAPGDADPGQLDSTQPV